MNNGASETTHKPIVVYRQNSLLSPPPTFQKKKGEKLPTAVVGQVRTAPLSIRPSKTIAYPCVQVSLADGPGGGGRPASNLLWRVYRKKKK